MLKIVPFTGVCPGAGPSLVAQCAFPCRHPCADVATAVAAALVPLGTVLIEAAQVQAHPVAPGDGTYSPLPAMQCSRCGAPSWGAPEGTAGSWLAKPHLTSGGVHADAAAAAVGAALSPGAL